MKHLLPLLALLCLTACRETITYETTFSKYSSEDYDICKTQQCPIVDLSILHLEQPLRLKTLINTWIKEVTLQELNLLIDQDYASLEDGLAEYLNTAQIGYPETSVLSDAHELTIDTALSFTSNTLLSAVFYGYQFSGGASGYDTIKYINANPQTGEEFADHDLFKEDFYAFAKAELKEQYPNTSFNVQSDSTTIQDIGFTDEGIVMIYIDATTLDLSTEQLHLLIPWKKASDYITF